MALAVFLMIVGAGCFAGFALANSKDCGPSFNWLAYAGGFYFALSSMCWAVG